MKFIISKFYVTAMILILVYIFLRDLSIKPRRILTSKSLKRKLFSIFFWFNLYFYTLHDTKQFFCIVNKGKMATKGGH